MSYYNTTNESGEELKANEAATKTQDEHVKSIIDIFNKYTEGKTFSPKDVYQLFDHTKTPITSIRRSINTLLNEGYIHKTGEKVEGLYGRKELQYRKSLTVQEAIDADYAIWVETEEELNALESYLRSQTVEHHDLYMLPNYLYAPKTVDRRLGLGWNTGNIWQGKTLKTVDAKNLRY